MRSLVSKGHLIWTKCTSLTSSIPASRIAIATAFIVAPICASRPISSGRKSRVWATPTLKRFSPAPSSAAPQHRLRANTVICGESTPSVPPDMTNAILASTARGASFKCGASALHNAATAYSRVKSFTPPLPSVFPSTARMDSGASAPLSIRAMRPETSPGPLVGMRVTSTEFVSMAAPPPDQNAKLSSTVRAEPDREQRRDGRFTGSRFQERHPVLSATPAVI